MDINSEEILVRSVVSWAVGLLFVASASAYAARPGASKDLPLWVGLPVILGQFLYFGAAVGVGAVLEKALHDRSQPLKIVIVPLGILTTLWVSSIILQLAQNFGYRLVGAPSQKLRFYRQRPARQRKRRVKE